MSLSDAMTELRAAKKAELDELLTGPTSEKRDLTEDESTKFDTLATEIRAQDERITQLIEAEKREAAAAASRVLTGNVGEKAVGNAQVIEKPVYQRGDYRVSYFRDLHLATKSDPDREAADRLRRNSVIETEKRALGNTGGAGGSGGEFAPPLWLVDEFVALARPGRIAADLFTKETLPPGVSSINIPKVATGTTVALQSTQNSALSQTDMTTTSLSSNISTIGGKQVVSVQLLEQSAIPFDRVIMGDLALAYAGQLDIQALTGAGTSGALRGLANAAGITSQAYTQATPSVAGTGGLYSNIAKAISQVFATRYLPPDTILMHPRRWAWICAAFDTSNRPLVVPSALAYNPIATDDTNVAQGYVGQLQGLAVYTDPNIPINTGSGTNQDPIYVFRRGDVFLWESATPTVETFTQPYADSMGVLYRLYSYSSLIPDRYGSSIVVVNGTGTVTPTF
jgi:HK97 family phage major capsid protein